MVAPVQSRDPFVSHVVTVSAYDEQHSVAARYCLKRGFGAKRGLTCARAEDESVWPEVTIWTLQRVLRQYAVRFRNDDNFHLSQIKRRDHRSILTQVELEDLAATMRESALAGLPFSKSDRNSMVIYRIVAVLSFCAEVCYGDLSYEHSVSCCSVKVWCRGMLC